MIEVLNRQGKYWISRYRFRRLLKFLITHYELPNPEVTLAFVDTRTIRKLNRQFLNKDAPTDVLSFPVEGKSADGRVYLGDIIISVPQAFKQSFREAHGLEQELEDLTVHGFLHLLGYDHGTGIEEEEEKVRRLLDERLRLR
jgi:probable rRNA maturation factor